MGAQRQKHPWCTGSCSGMHFLESFWNKNYFSGQELQNQPERVFEIYSSKKKIIIPLAMNSIHVNQSFIFRFLLPFNSRLQQYEAMKWLKDDVSINHRCLFLYTLASLKNSTLSRSTSGSASVIILQHSFSILSQNSIFN